MNTRIFLTASLSLSMLAGCQTADLEPRETLDLRVALGLDDVVPVGITVDPDTGRRFLLDAAAGLFELKDDGTAELLIRQSEWPAADVPPQSLFTDIVALGGDRFALTAVSDGYILDLNDDSLTQHFCYEPGWGGEWTTTEQLTTSLGFDPATNSILAQPQTREISEEGTTPLGAAVGVYDAELGGATPRSWLELTDADFLATGMAVETSSSILLAEEDGSLHRFSLETANMESLGRIPDVVQVGAMTLAGDRLLVTDSERDLLIEFDAP